MCLLTFFPGGVQPHVNRLWNGAIENNDGHGYAIVAGDELIVRKGLDPEAVIEQFEHDRQQYPDGPAMFHSRWSTHGHRTALDNCHPFYVGSDRRTVLAHNGILPKEAWPKKGDPRSDTRVAAETLIPSLGSLRRPWLREFVTQWMGTGNKIVILTVNPKFRSNHFILNEGAGEWVDGVWYSNGGYRPSIYTACVADTKRWWENAEYAEEVGPSVAYDVEHGVRCPECLCQWSDCDCWVPASQRQQHTAAKNGYPLD